MSATFKHRLLVWVWNLVNAAVSGGATAGAAIATGKVFGAAGFTVRQLGVVALSGAALSAFNYVRENRLPMIDG